MGFSINRSRSVLLVVTLLVPFLTSACQSAMSVEEAKKVTASFSGTSFVPPPRTVNDVFALLDQQEPADPEAAARTRARADQPAPATENRTALALFYYERALAAGQIGRTKQELVDFNEAARLSPSVDILFDLAIAEAIGGNYRRALQVAREALGRAPADAPGYRTAVNGLISRVARVVGDRETAKAASSAVASAYREAMSRFGSSPDRVFWEGNYAGAQASEAEVDGQLVAAEGFWRQAIAARAARPNPSARRSRPSTERINLIRVLRLQERLLEAENEARATLRIILAERGRYSSDTAAALSALADVLRQQGRYVEAERLLRAVMDINEKTGVSAESLRLATTRDSLGATLAAQGRWQEALVEYEQIRSALSADPTDAQTFLAANVTYGLVLLERGQPDQAAEVFRTALERRARVVGEGHASVAEIRGFLAMALAAKGDRARALNEFASATEILVARPTEPAGDESGTRGERDQRLSLILTAYIGLLADIQGTPLEQPVGGSAAAQAFRLAEVARGRSVQRALDASAARAAAKTPALADLVRRHQDAGKQLTAFYGMLAQAVSAPTDQQDTKAVDGLRSRIDALARAREALGKQITTEFPAYAQLTNPPPATVEQARASLRSGEAWLVTYVAKDRTYVWAIPQQGAIAFAAAPLGEEALASTVSSLRQALDPTAKTLGDIPEFDLSRAHTLYRTLLGPVATGWRGAESLLVVAHGPLAQLPFALLPTQAASLPAEQRPIFSNYRAVPWLVRTHAVTLLPSVTSLATLRALPPGDPARRPFVGFGDPYFSEEQARRAAARQATPVQVAEVTTRAVPITLRSSPSFRGVDSSQLAMLPPLPETAEEIRSIAIAMNADLTRDVFLGERANEQAVRTLDLAGYRVIVFATHGLVPGDLDGLTQPALALSAPSVAKVEGDGLLTMEKILGLRLTADWVVLSACNSASGQGTGSEAISGLGRAFFYAGARALLVSNWPVETTSARALTTDLFRRQQARSCPDWCGKEKWRILPVEKVNHHHPAA